MPKLTLKSIERHIEALQLKAEKLKQKDKKPAIREIVGLMRKHDLSLGDVRQASAGRGGNGKATVKRRTRKVKPLYRNSKTGETWSGRGRTARWLAAAEKAGHKRAEFLIKKA